MDVPFEAAFLRAGLLIGLVHEREVPEWAAGAISGSPALAPRLADLLLANVELSAMREALWPLSSSVEAPRVTAALLTALALEHAARAKDAIDLLRILGVIRTEFKPPTNLAAAIKDFEDRAMLARAGSQRVVAPGAEEIGAWLARVRDPGYFRFHFDRNEERAAFVAALARKIVRDRTWSKRPGQLSARTWLLAGASEASVVVLNESAWEIAGREFAPVPIACRIPYPQPDDAATELFDEASATMRTADYADGRRDH
ncbi:MAG: hypothetical protein ACHQO8_08435 [Vicinamibacterales bacterium]